jgi:hypothetical protein
MRKALGLILSPLLLGSVVASSLVAPQLTNSAQAETRKTFNTNDTKVCRSRDDLRNLSRYVEQQQYFGVTPEAVNNWRGNGLQVPQATTPQNVIVKGDIVIFTNGFKNKKPIKNIEVTLPLLKGGNKGDYYNAAAAVLKVRGLTNTGCMNAENKNQPFAINSRYNFAWENVTVKGLSDQNSQTNDSSDGITAY